MHRPAGTPKSECFGLIRVSQFYFVGRLLRSRKDLWQSLLDFPVVGIGALAGGIETLLRLFENRPTDAGMAFVIVLDSSSNYKSVADQVL